MTNATERRQSLLPLALFLVSCPSFAASTFAETEGTATPVENARDQDGPREGSESRAPRESETRSSGWTGDLAVGGNARLFLFTSTEAATSGARQDAEQGALRLTLQHELRPEIDGSTWAGIRFEAHGVISGKSPIENVRTNGGLTGNPSTGHRQFDLQTEVLGSRLARHDVRMWAEIDRLNARFDHRRFRLTVGRQPITWGVNYFWPALDLFGPFSPAAIDRDYKPGVDAVRLSLPVGDFSEVQLIAAAHGGQDLALDRGRYEWSHGFLGRFHVGGADLGVLLGRFFGDDVAGGFATTDAGGFGLRAEVLYTNLSEGERTPIGSTSDFWRATVGIDRLLSPRTSLVAEISWNGFGARDPADYPLLAASDRVGRGEITSLGREYSGVSVSFQASPLWTLNGAVLTNWGDHSTLIQPSVSWSLSNNASATFGGFLGLGGGLEASGAVASEYGAIPTTLWASVKTYF